MDAKDIVDQFNEWTPAHDVLQRVAAAQSSDPATDDLTVPLAIELAEKETEIERLQSALRFGCGAAISSLPPGEREWSPTSGIGIMLKALGCGALVYGDEVRAALANEQTATEKKS